MILPEVWLHQSCRRSLQQSVSVDQGREFGFIRTHFWDCFLGRVIHWTGSFGLNTRRNVFGGNRSALWSLFQLRCSNRLQFLKWNAACTINSKKRYLTIDFAPKVNSFEFDRSTELSKRQVKIHSFVDVESNWGSCGQVFHVLVKSFAVHYFNSN